MTRLLTAWRIWRSAYGDVRTPLMAKALPFIAVLYLLSPLDFVPDFIPVLGQLDDVGMILLLCTIAWRLIPKDLKAKHAPGRANVIDIDPR